MKYGLLLVLWMAPALFGQEAPSCVFCEIVRGAREVSQVLRNDKVMAFMDHAPINPGHTLVIPLEHSENLDDTPPDIAREMMAAAQRIGAAFKNAGIRAEAFQMHMNNGPMVQNVRHAHLHVYPRFQGDFPGDSVVRLASQRTRPPRQELDAVASRLRRSLDLSEAFERFYEEELELFPVNATFAGDPRYNDRLPNTLTDEYRAGLRVHYQKFLDKMREFDREALGPAEQASFDTLVWDCETGLASLEFREELLPVNQFSSLHLEMAVLGGGTGAQPFQTVRDYENWLKRLESFARWCETAIERMREGIEQGYVLPKALTEKLIPQLARMAVGPAEKHPFYAPVIRMPDQIETGERERLADAYRAAIRRQVIPAYAQLHAFTATEYLAASRPTSGISAIPRGREYYDLQIRIFTTLDLTADEVHDLGLREVQRIAGEMEKVKKQAGFEGSLRDFFAHVRSRRELMPFTDPRSAGRDRRKGRVLCPALRNRAPSPRQKHCESRCGETAAGFLLTAALQQVGQRNLCLALGHFRALAVEYPVENGGVLRGHRQSPANTCPESFSTAGGHTR